MRNNFFKFIFKILEDFLKEVSLKKKFILGKNILKKNLTITLISIIKSNFTLSYSNKNHYRKLIFNIRKSNTNQFFKK